jgi:dUTP pyrophosphatase
MKVELPILVLPHGEGLPLPAYQTAGAAGLDLCAAVPEDAPLLLAPMGRALVPTGLRLAIPPGYEGQVRPRSGNALRLGLGMINAPGTIDSDYRGELMVLLANFGAEPVRITRGMRVAQLVVCPVARAELRPVLAFDDTPRGDQGFGSTGSH